MPGRSSVIFPSAMETTVDSIPTRVGPPSSTGTESPKAALTCPAVVGESSLNRFALGAAIGTPQASINSRATGCAGTRTPTVGESGGDDIGDVSGFRKHQREGSGPPALGEFFCFARPLGDQSPRHLDGRSVDDQRAGFRAAFQFENFCDGGSVERVRAQAVNGFRGEGDQAAVAEVSARLP